MARYCKDENGNLILTAGGTRFWVVTQARHDAAVQAGTAPNNCVVAITDDYPSKDGEVDITLTSVVTEGSIRVERKGNVVIVHVMNLVVNTRNINVTLATGLPKPSVATYNTITGGLDLALGQLQVTTSGVLNTGWGMASTSAQYTGELVYFTEE